MKEYSGRAKSFWSNSKLSQSRYATATRSETNIGSFAKGGPEDSYRFGGDLVNGAKEGAGEVAER